MLIHRYIYILAIIITTLTSTQGVAQDFSRLPQVVRLDSNMLRFPGGVSENFDALVERIDSVLLFGRGRINIMHIGGSHVQADMYTHYIRQNLDSLNGCLHPARGFIFPYAIARTNNPLNYRVKYGGTWISARNAIRQFYPTQGASGINVRTADTTAWFDIDLNTDSTQRYYTTHLRIFGRSIDGRTKPYMLLPDSTIVEASESDSATYLFNLSETTSRFGIRFHFTYDTAQNLSPDTFVITGMYADNDEPGIVYNSIGVNGASVPSFLNCANFERDLGYYPPDLVIFGIGINDATSSHFSDSLLYNNYLHLIDRIQKVAPKAAFIFITNNDSFMRIRRKYYVNKNGEVARTAFYRLASHYKGAVWDLFEIMGGLNSMQEWQRVHLARRDKVHFTRDGYLYVGRLFTDAFLNFYYDYDCTYGY